MDIKDFSLRLQEKLGHQYDVKNAGMSTVVIKGKGKLLEFELDATTINDDITVIGEILDSIKNEAEKIINNL